MSLVTTMKVVPVDYDPFVDGNLVQTVPATEVQKEIWAAVQLGDDASCAFNESISIHLRGTLQTDAIRAAIDRLVLRHEAMRTTFSPDGELLCILESFKPDIADLDLSAEPDPASALCALCVREVETPFNLEHGPLYRFSLVKLSDSHHVLVVTAHHIVFDGWSSAVATREIGLLYDEIRGLDVEPLPTAPRYSDYVAYLQSLDPAVAENYWIEQFKGSLPAVDLPLDKARPAFRTFASERVDHLIDSDLIAGLQDVGRKSRGSLFVVLLSAWMAYLHRISGSTDLVTGMPAAGQNASGMHGLVGHCVNLLPIRVGIDPSLPFDRLVGLVRDKVLDAVEHQNYTFGSLLKALPIPRDPSRIPLVPVQFNLDPVGTVAEGFTGLEVRVSSNPRSYENFELFLNLTKVLDGIQIECQFNTDLFESTGIQERLREFVCLLESIVASPERSLATLRVVPEQWQRQIVEDWNATHAPFNLDISTYALIEAQCARTPDRVAVADVSGTMTYRALEERVNRVANALRSRGIGGNSLVGIALKRNADMVVATLAAWKVGTGYVPLDPEFPVDRLHYMLEDADVALVISVRDVAARLSLEDRPRLLLDDEAESTDAEAPKAEPSGAGPDDLAYMIYTSGSTGKPKGVRVLHRNVVNFLRAMAERPGLGQDDRLLAVTTLSFDIAVLELFLPLTVGARAVVADKEQTRDGEALSRLLRESSATVMQATPATWRMLVESDWRPGRPFTALCGGEALPGELAERLIGRVDKLFNMYGPTETTVWSSVHEVTKPAPVAPIGTPIHNTQMYVLSEAMQVMPIGVAGELYIGGDGVTDGYHRRDELTRERFVPSPFRPGAKLYRTGDLARWRRDGQLEYLGRIDAQVKVRGFRIELGEIEAAMLGFNGVKEAVANVYEPIPGDTRLVAYYVPSTAAELPVAELRTHLARFLPNYMLPQHFVCLERIPLTPNRKADRKALPAPEAPSRREIIAPRTQAETAVAAVWKRVLGVDELGVGDDFFELGGHSILAARVIARLRDDLGIQLPLRRLFENPRLEALAAHVATLTALRDSSSVQVDGGDREEISF